MKKTLKRAVALALAGVLAAGALAFTGCSSSSSASTSASSSEPKVLNVGANTYSVDVSLDPLDGSWNYCYVCYEGMAETLFRIGDDWSAGPWLATDAKATDSTNKVWEVTLRDDVTYHNGNKMTAATVKECLDRAMEKSVQAKGILNMTDIKADGQKLTITLAEPCVDLAHELCNSVFVIYDKPADGSDYANGISYTGPFMPGEYQQGVSRSFVAYDNYYGGRAKLDQVNFVVYSDTAAQLVALDKGEIDFMQGVPFENLAKYEADSNFTVAYADPNSDEMFYFNENRDGVNDVAVRKAIAMALDRETICKDVYYGYAKPQYVIFSDQFSFGGTDGINLSVTKYDLDGAKKLLADAGWADTNGDGTLDKDGTELNLSLVCYPDTYIMSAADTLATALKQLGITVTINPTRDYPSIEKSGDFDIMWTYEGVTRSGTATYFVSNFLSTNGAGNHAGFSSAAVDEAAEKLAGTTDAAEIRKLIVQAEQAVADDGVMVTWGMRAIPFVHNAKVDFTPHAYRYYMIDNTTDIK